MYKRLGNKFALISAAALLLAACSGKDEEPATTAPTVEEETISQPVEQPKTAEQIKIETFGLGDQSGLTGYMGNDRVFFAYDSSELSADARADLRKAADWLAAYPRLSVTVEGHCDERGTREYNLALGERRATAVKNYLVALNVPASRVKTISYGKERLAEVGSGESTHSQNRRGVLVLD